MRSPLQGEVSVTQALSRIRRIPTSRRIRGETCVFPCALCKPSFLQALRLAKFKQPTRTSALKRGTRRKATFAKQLKRRDAEEINAMLNICCFHCGRCERETHFLPIHRVLRATGVSRSTVYYWIDKQWVHWIELPSGRKLICEESLHQRGSAQPIYLAKVAAA
jgi:predicted DNA-binding transcriptional regulator AlpA